MESWDLLGRRSERSSAATVWLATSASRRRERGSVLIIVRII